MSYQLEMAGNPRPRSCCVDYAKALVKGFAGDGWKKMIWGARNGAAVDSVNCSQTCVFKYQMLSSQDK